MKVYKQRSHYRGRGQRCRMIIKNKPRLIFGIIDIALGTTAVIFTFMLGESVVYRLIISLALVVVGILNMKGSKNG